MMGTCFDRRLDSHGAFASDVEGWLVDRLVEPLVQP